MTTKQVKSVRENARPSYTGKNGATYIHEISFAEPIDVEGTGILSFEYHSLDQKCSKFVPGQEATFEVGVRENKGYKNYFIKPVEVKKPFGGFSAGKKAEPKDQGTISALSCASTAANYYQQRQSTPEQVIKFAEELFQWATSKSTLK